MGWVNRSCGGTETLGPFTYKYWIPTGASLKSISKAEVNNSALDNRNSTGSKTTVEVLPGEKYELKLEWSTSGGSAGPDNETRDGSCSNYEEASQKASADLARAKEVLQGLYDGATVSMGTLGLNGTLGTDLKDQVVKISAYVLRDPMPLSSVDVAKGVPGRPKCAEEAGEIKGGKIGENLL